MTAHSLTPVSTPETDAAAPLFDLKITVNGYGATSERALLRKRDATTDEYAEVQAHANVRKTLEFVLPLVRSFVARSVLDVGCGVGTMVRTLRDYGFDAYGVDLVELEHYWRRHGHSPAHFFIVDPLELELPFADGSIDFAFSLGVIEHVGTSDGHATRLPNYRAIRRHWLREVYRAVRPGGHLLIGGPNRRFPVDVAHGLDSAASRVETALSRMVGASVHNIFGDNFLWAYSDIAEYLDGLPYSMTPLNVGDYVGYSRVPRVVRGLVTQYVKRMPRRLLGTGFNPWVMALIRKHDA